MLNSNTFYKIISVILAVVLWAYVIQVMDPMKKETIKDVPVQLLNEESLTARGLALSGSTDYTVDVVVEGKKGELSKLTSEDISANADLFGFSLGKNYIAVITSAPDGVDVLEVKPNKINVAIEELIEVAKPIDVNFTGKFANGVEAGRILTQPEEVEVSGAKSDVDAVDHIRVDIQASKLTTEGTTIQAKAYPVNKMGDVVENVRLSSAYIDVSGKLYHVKEVPLTVEVTGEVAPIYEVTNLDVPSSIKIKGSKEALNAVDVLTASAIDISDVSSTAEIPVNVPFPDGVEPAKGYENLTVDISIKPVATKEFTFTADEIEIEGIEGTTNISITTPQINIIASGSEAVIGALMKSDLQPYIDLDAESLLSATAKVQVRYKKQLGHITVGPEEVHITLNQTE